MAAWRRPVTSTSRTTIAATIQAGATPCSTSITSAREHEDLVGDRVEERADGGVRPCRRASLPVEPVGRHRDAEDRGRPVVVVGEAPGVEHDHERDRRGARDGELIGRREVHGVENTARSCSTRFWSPTEGRSRSASSGRCASSASARSASTRRATAPRCTSPTRTRRSCSGRRRRPRATSRSTASSTRRSAPGRRPSIPATASSPRTRRSRGPWRTPGSSGSARRPPRSS